MKRLLILHYGLRILFIFIFGILSGCQKSTPMQTQENETTTFKSTQVITTQLTTQATFTPQSFMTPTNTIVPTSIPVPTRTFTPTLMSTWTPMPILPTLSPAESKVVIKDLLVNNAGCKLPCWWGITPGKTAWNETNQFLATFTTIDGPAVYTEDNVTHERYAVIYNLDKKEYSFGVKITNGVVMDIYLGPDETIFGQQLKNLLMNNGKPKGVWVASLPSTPGGSWFYLAIYYPEKGIIAMYNGSAKPIITTDSEGKANITGISICPVDIGPELRLIPPNMQIGGYVTKELWGQDFADILIPIQYITEMSVDDFYLTFRDADSSTCFETNR